MPERATRKPLLSLFIVVYLFVTAYELFPRLPLRKQVFKPIQGAVDYLGLWQNFAVFVPDPRKNNIYLDAVVAYGDGTSAVWNYPRMEQLGLLERMQKERYRKFGHDHAYFGNESMLWPDLAHFVAQQSQRPGTQATSVTLRRHWADIPPPDKGLEMPSTAHYGTEIMYRHDLTGGADK